MLCNPALVCSGVDKSVLAVTNISPSLQIACDVEESDIHSKAGVASLCGKDLAEARHQALGNCTALYNSHAPLHIVEGEGCWLADDDGKSYLDCVNNVAHVGHSNPRVSVCGSLWLCWRQWTRFVTELWLAGNRSSAGTNCAAKHEHQILECGDP